MPVQARPLLERLLAKVERSGDCWLWTGAKDDHGYGVIGLGGRGTGNGKAHRVSHELHVGPIGEGLYLCHQCDTPACINPAHLTPGTQGDNMRDAASKGRIAKQSITHCPKGHEYTPDNIVRANGSSARRCRTCHNTKRRRQRAERHDAQRVTA